VFQVARSIQFRQDLTASVCVGSSITDSPVLFGKWSEVRDMVLAASEYVGEAETPLSPLNHISKLLTDYLDMVAVDCYDETESTFKGEEGSQFRSVLSFASEQIQLLLQPATGRTYSDELRAVALEMHTASAAAYRILRKKRVCILPAPRTLFNLSRDFRCVPGIDNRQIDLLAHRCSELTGIQRVFVCEVDEIYNDKKLELKGGTVRLLRN
jgi:hypothetical protein